MIKEKSDTGITKKLGRIPEGWIVKLLGDFFEFKNGLNKGKEFFGYGTPIINYMDVNKKNSLKSNDIKGKVSLTTSEIQRFNIKKGDVFFTRTSETIDEIAYSTVLLENVENGVFSGFVLRARPKKENVLDIEFTKYCFSTNLARKEIMRKSTFTTRALTNGRFLSEVNLLIPPLPEQQKIAQILSTWDKAIALQDQLIQEKQALKKGLMQQLLTGKKRFAEFEEEWEEVRLKNILEYEQPTKYIVDDDSYSDSNKTPVLTANKSFVLGYTNETEGIYKALPIILFDDFTTDNKWVDFPFKVKSSAIKILKLKNKEFDLRFVFERIQLLNFNKTDHKRYYISEYQFLKFECPKLEEQQKIAAVLSSFDTEIEHLQQHKTAFIQQKQGLMQQLLSGEKRVKI